MIVKLCTKLIVSTNPGRRVNYFLNEQIFWSKHVLDRSRPCRMLLRWTYLERYPQRGGRGVWGGSASRCWGQRDTGGAAGATLCRLTSGRLRHPVPHPPPTRPTATAVATATIPASLPLYVPPWSDQSPQAYSSWRFVSSVNSVNPRSGKTSFDGFLTRVSLSNIHGVYYRFRKLFYCLRLCWISVDKSLCSTQY